MTTGPAPRRKRITAGGDIRYYGADDPSCIYRLYNREGDLIYVGMSYDPVTRIRVQRSTQPWGHEVARHEIEWFPNRKASEKAEEALIKQARPKYNVVHTPEHRLRSVAHMPVYVRQRAEARTQAELAARAQQIAEGRTTGRRAKDDETAPDTGT